MPQIKLINLTAEELFQLLSEKPISKDGICLNPQSSFLAVLSLFELEAEKQASRVSALNT